MEQTELKRINDVFSKSEVESVNKPFLVKLEKYLEHESLLLESKQDEIEHLKADSQHHLKECSEKLKKYEEDDAQMKDALKKSEDSVKELSEKFHVCEKTCSELEGSVKVLEAKLTDAETRLSLVLAEKETFREALTRKQSEMDILLAQIKNLNEQLLNYEKEKWQLRGKEDEIQLKESSLQLRENHMKNINALLEKQIQDLQKELDEKNVEILMRSKENSAEILRLKEELDRNTDELKGKEEALERAKATMNQQSNTIDELTERIRESVELENQVKSALRQELSAQKRIADLHQDGQRVAEDKLKQATDGVRDLQKALREAIEKYGDLETKFEEEKLRHASEVEKHREVVSKLEEELRHANELLEKKGATVGDLSMLTPAGAAVVKSGLTITQMYSEYATISEKYAILEAEHNHLKEYTEKIIRDVEERVPMIKQQAFELQKERQESEELREQLAQGQNLISRCRYEAEISKSDAMFQKRQNARLEMQLKDLQRQVVTLLKENHQYKIGAPIADSPEDLGYDDDMPQAQRLISEKFVTFKDIVELQENNQRLLGTIRKLSEDSEAAEAAAVAERTRELTAEVAKLKSQIQVLEDSRSRSAEMVEKLRQQYDGQKALADSLNSSIVKRNEVDTSLLSAKDDRISELKQEIRDLNRKAEEDRSGHKEALAQQRKELQAAIDKLNSDNNDLKVNVEKVTNLLEIEEEKFKKLLTATESSKKEIAALLEKNAAVTGLSKSQEAQVASLRQEVLSLEQKLARSEATVTQLQRERQNLRDNVQRLTQEIGSLRQTPTQFALADKLESLRSEMTQRNAAETDRLKSDLERMRSECEILRNQMSKQLGIFESSREEWRARERELKGEIEVAKLREGQVRNELIEAQQKTEKLQRQLGETSEALKIHQRLAVPKSPAAQQPMSARFSTIQMELLEAKNQIEELNAEIERLQTKVRETEAQRDQYHSMTEAREAQVKEVTKQMENSMSSLQKELDAVKAESSGKNEEIATLRASLHSVNHEISQFETVKEQIRAERQKELEKIENDLKAASVTVNFMNQKIAELKNEVKATKSAVEEKDVLYKNELIAHAKSVEQMKALREELTEIKNRVVAAEQTAVEAVAKHRLLEEKAAVDVQALETRVQELNSSNAELRKINDCLQDQVTKLSESAETERDLNVSSSLDDERTNQQLLEVIAFLRRESNLVRAQLERAEAENACLSAQAKQLQSQVAGVEADLKRERGSPKQSLPAADHEELLRKVETMTSLQDSNRRLRDEISILQSQHEEMMQKLAAATKEVEPLKERNRKLTEEFDSLSVEATVLRNEITRVKTQSAVFSRGVSERARFQAEKEGLEKTLKEKEAELARVKDSLNTALKQMEVAQRNFNQSKATIDQLNSRNEQTNVKVEQLIQKLDETEKSKSIAEEELVTVKSKLESTAAELATTKTELEKVNSTAAQLKTLGRKYKRQYEELEKVHAELKKAEQTTQAVPVKEEAIKSEEEAAKKGPEGPRRLTTAEVFTEPSTTSEQVKQENGRIAELESSLSSVTESRDLAVAQSNALKEELQNLKKENDELKAKVEKLQNELNQAKAEAQEKEKLKSSVAELAIKNSSLLQQIDELTTESDFLRAKVTKLEKDLSEASSEKERLTAELQRTKEQKLSRTLPQEAPTANVRPMASPAPQPQTASKLALQTRTLPTAPPTASIRPMAMQPRTVGQATPIVTCTATEVTPMTSSVSTHPPSVQPTQADRPTTPVVAMVPPTPSNEPQGSEGVNEGASTSRGKSAEPEAQTPESTLNQQKIKRQREPDSTPDESSKKRVRDEDVQESVQTAESLQREAELRRSLLAGRRTVASTGSGFTVTVPVMSIVRSAVIQPSAASSAVEDVVELSSDSSDHEESGWGDLADEGSYEEGDHSGDSEDNEEEGSDEEHSDESNLSNENEATVGDESVDAGDDSEAARPADLPESSHADLPSRSGAGEEMDESVVPSTPILVKPRIGESPLEVVVSPQQGVPSRTFFFGASNIEGQTSAVSRDIETTRMDLSQMEDPMRAGPSTERSGEEALESSVIIEEIFEEVAEVSTSGQEASAGDGGEQADSPINGNESGAVGASNYRITRNRAADSARTQRFNRGGLMLRRPQQGASPNLQEQASPSRGAASGRARRSRGSFK